MTTTSILSNGFHSGGITAKFPSRPIESYSSFAAWTLPTYIKFNLGVYKINSTGDVAAIGGASGTLVDLYTGGTGGQSGATTYNAGNGVVVTSSAAVYTNNGYYYMSNMFSGDVSTDSANHHWLTSSIGDQTLTFNFTNSSVSYIQKMRIYPKARTDSFSNIKSISTSNDGTTWTEVYGNQNLSSSIAFGTYYDYTLQTTDSYVRITLERTGSWGVCLHEVQFYEAVVIPAEGLLVEDGSVENIDKTLPPPYINFSDRISISASKPNISAELVEYRKTILSINNVVPYDIAEIRRREGSTVTMTYSRGIASDVTTSGGEGSTPTTQVSTQTWY